MREPSASIVFNDLPGERSTPPFLRWSRVKPIFLYSLLLSTWLPMLFFILSSRLESPTFAFQGTRTLLLFLGTAHVPATLFFYVDKDFSDIIRNDKRRYIYLPILLTVATGLVFAFAPVVVQAYILLAFWSWQAFHYGRQNVGIYSFVSIATRGKPSDKYERLIIDLGTWCGIIGTFKILGSAVAPQYLQSSFDLAYQLARFLFVLVLVASVVIYVRNFRSTTPLLTIFYFTLVCFFLPVFLSTGMNVGFYSYAIAHGVQYVLFMTVVSLNFDPDGAAQRFHLRNLMKLLLLTVLIGLIFYKAIDLKTMGFVVTNTTFVRLVDFALGAILGSTMAHFVIDAGAWRLSESLQRMYVGKRFAFLFRRQPEALR